jgi:hypothetical protein
VQPPLYQATAAARTVPAGTALVLTVIPEIVPPLPAGAVFDAVVMRDVLNDSGGIVIGKGSPAELTAAADGRVALRAVMVHGNTYLVRPAIGDPGAVPLAGPDRLPANSIVTFRVSGAFLLVTQPQRQSSWTGP